jgi:trehalose utilization protein
VKYVGTNIRKNTSKVDEASQLRDRIETSSINVPRHETDTQRLKISDILAWWCDSEHYIATFNKLSQQSLAVAIQIRVGVVNEGDREIWERRC